MICVFSKYRYLCLSMQKSSNKSRHLVPFGKQTVIDDDPNINEIDIQTITTKTRIIIELVKLPQQYGNQLFLFLQKNKQSYLIGQSC